MSTEEPDISAITTEDLLREKAEDEYCKKTSDRVDQPETNFEVGSRGLLVTRAPHERLFKIVVPDSLRAP